MAIEAWEQFSEQNGQEITFKSDQPIQGKSHLAVLLELAIEFERPLHII